MTPAQREIVSLFMEDMAEILSFGRADYQPVSRDIYAALRAALVERGTCGTCRWAQSSTCVNPDSMHDVTKVMHEDDGCIKGWAPREDAPEDAR